MRLPHTLQLMPSSQHMAMQCTACRCCSDAPKSRPVPGRRHSLQPSLNKSCGGKLAVEGHGCQLLAKLSIPSSRPDPESHVPQQWLLLAASNGRGVFCSSSFQFDGGKKHERYLNMLTIKVDDGALLVGVGHAPEHGCDGGEAVVPVRQACDGSLLIKAREDGHIRVHIVHPAPGTAFASLEMRKLAQKSCIEV